MGGGNQPIYDTEDAFSADTRMCPQGVQVLADGQVVLRVAEQAWTGFSARRQQVAARLSK